MYYVLRVKNSILYFVSHVLAIAFVSVACYLLLATCYISPAFAQTPATWQNSSVGLKTSSTQAGGKTAGLTVAIRSATPSAYLQGGVVDTGSWMGPRLRDTIFIDLGEIKASGTTPILASESADWAHNEMTFSSNLKIWVSRLSPAVLVQNLNNSLRLFSGNLGGAKIVAGVVKNSTPTPSYPKYIAYSTGGAIQIKQIPVSTATSLNLPTLDNNWVLVWYGNNSHFLDSKGSPAYISPDTGGMQSIIPLTTAYQADAPMLLKFENNPASIKQSPEGGIDLTFAVNSGGYTSMMPLFGREHLKASDTEGWGTISTLPSTVVSKINFWATSNKLCSYPTNVSEDYLPYNPTTDTSTISETITYLNVCSGGSATSGFAILPPMLSIAKDALGTNFSVSKALTDANYSTEFGPILGIDKTNTYSYSVSGLKKYTDSQSILGSGAVPNELIQKITKQTDEVVASGHFSPWIFGDRMPHSVFQGDIFFLNPADVVYSLVEIVPVLPEPQKTNLINYLKTERTNYPPETVYSLPITAGNGTIRNFFALDPGDLDGNMTVASRWQSIRKDLFLNRLPLYNFFALSRYYELTQEAVPSTVLTQAKTALDTAMAEQDWASFSWFKGFETNRAAVINTNRHLDGLIGFTKLAKLAGDIQVEGLGRSLLAKSAISRIAMAKYPRYLYNTNLINLPTDPVWMPKYSAGTWFGYIWNYNWANAYDDHTQVVIQDQFGTFLFDQTGYFQQGTTVDYNIIVSSELNAYRDLVPEAFRLITDFAKQDFEIYLNKYTTLLPHWYTAFSEAILANEHNVNRPIDSFQTFMAKVFIQNDTPQNLRRFSSIPWVSGDFFYMQKLAETIKAYQGWTWSDQITGQPCNLSSASWNQTTVTTGQTVNLNAQVTGDCAGKTVTFEVHRNGLGDDLSAISKQPNPQTVSFSGGNQTSTSWIAEHNPLIVLTDPQYYFKATLSGGNTLTTATLLTVNNASGGPTLTPTPVPPTPTQPASTPTSVPPTPTRVASASATQAPTVTVALTPTPTTAPCNLASASWSATTTTQGSTVNLNVSGNTNCSGKTVNFEVRRNGTLIDDIPANIQPQSASMSATFQASTTWTAERNPLIPFTDAQYYFKATPQGGNTIESNPRLITVTTGGTGTPIPTPVPTAPNDWPQVQKDAQHTGYSSETLGTNFKVAWTYPFQPDRVFPQTQAIIYQGKAIVGTEGANGQKPTIYAFDAVKAGPPTWQPTGIVLWKFEAGGPILNSVAAFDNKIFFGSMDGAVYALNSATGAQIWKNQISKKGFSTAPIVADGKVMMGSRDGNFYAFDLNDGHVIWKYNAGAPILQTAAYDQGKAFFGSMEMYVYGVNTSDGTQVWKSQRIPGTAFKDYWPVVTQGKVIIISMVDRKGAGLAPGFPFGWYRAEEAHWPWVSQWGPTIAQGGAATVPDIMTIQDTMMNSYNNNPASFTKNMFILDNTTGQEAMVVPHTTYQTMNGATTPPCIDKEGKLVVPIQFIESGWGRLDLAQRRITDILYDGYGANGQPLANLSTSEPAGFGNVDENLTVSCAANEVLSFHFMEANANYTGAFDLVNRKWTRILAGFNNQQMDTNTQGGGTNPASISNGMIYHISIHELVARTTN